MCAWQDEIKEIQEKAEAGDAEAQNKVPLLPRSHFPPLPSPPSSNGSLVRLLLTFIPNITMKSTHLRIHAHANKFVVSLTLLSIHPSRIQPTLLSKTKQHKHTYTQTARTPSRFAPFRFLLLFPLPYHSHSYRFNFSHVIHTRC